MERSSEERRGGINKLEDIVNKKKMERMENSQLMNGSELEIMNTSQPIIECIVVICV